MDSETENFTPEQIVKIRKAVSIAEASTQPRHSSKDVKKDLAAYIENVKQMSAAIEEKVYA